MRQCRYKLVLPKGTIMYGEWFDLDKIIISRLQAIYKTLVNDFEATVNMEYRNI